ncbi:MAG: hypothetical protein EKK49_19820 [Rhodocyclaceae bacterium]|nr:MAG: hypothetical protein EKK49_19820 [Rhodocyclaceae bacterium]
MPAPSPLQQAAALPPVLLAGFIGYGQALELARWLMPVTPGSPLTPAILMSQGFLAATLLAALACYPLAWLYGKRAVAVSGLMTLPVLAVRVPGSLAPGKHALAIFLSAWEMLSFVVLLVGGTWLARRAHKDPSAA